jgi:hypothetical protein
MLDDSLDNVMWDLRTNICSGTIARGTWHHGERHQAARFSDDQVRAIRKLLSLQGVTQHLIARALDCSQTTVLNLSKGQHQLDNQAHTKRIAEDKDRVAQTLAYRQQS